MPSIKVLHYTTHDEECGIAKYQAQFIEGMKGEADIENTVFRYSPNQTKQMSKGEFSMAMDELSEHLGDFDILHIQHEHSFYKRDELKHIVDRAHKQSKKVMFTIHTAPEAMYQQPIREGLGPRSILNYLRKKRAAKYFKENHLQPISKADLLIVHNVVTKDSLVRHGVSPEKITVIRHPVPNVDSSPQSSVVTTSLRKNSGDVIFCTVGFLSKSKGILHAVKALKFLPENYKLAILGGMHPDGINDSFYDEVTDMILGLDLIDRVYVSGYVESDDNLNAMIRETDICVYPYDKKYYSYVSSGSLNSAIANHKPVIAYPTKSFKETNAEMEVIKFCRSGNYYELAREIRDIDIKKSSEMAKAYSEMFGWKNEAAKFSNIYRQLNA
jgi:glycosyltransferase involved in cell wall biosynthesis